MKRILVFIISLLLIQVAWSQGFQKAEYFFDADPGPGNGIPVTVPAIANDTIQFNVNIPASLAEGFHFLAIRVQHSNGQWGLFENRGFYISSAASNATNIVAAEYFFDSDPGAGNGIPITVNSGSIVNFTATLPATLSDGFHFLAIRTRDAEGHWGLFENRGFYLSSSSNNASNIVAAEYFFDSDPGAGNGTSIAVNNGSIVNFTATLPAALSDGFHFLAIRTKDADGHWGLFENRGFYISSSSLNAPDIVAAEYFFDADPGTGSGTPITVTNGAVVNFTATLPANLSAGFHFLAIRTKDANGRWGLFENRGFYVSAATSNLPDIVAAEYFLDVDPGPGNGIAIPIPTPGATINETFSLPLDASIPQGHHEFALRVKNSAGQWGLFQKDTFFIPFVVVPKVTLGVMTTTSFCAGANISVPYTVNIPFGTVNVFTAQLSNASGSFASPVNIGSISATDAGSIAATIPANTPAGANYRIRVIANSPKDTSNFSFNPITIGRVPELSYVINGVNNTCVGVQSYAASATETATYTWQLPTGGTLTPNAATASVNWTTAGLHTISLTASNTCGNGQTKTLDVRVFEAIPAIVPTISVSGRTLTASALNIAQGAAGWQWYKDGNLLTGQTGQSITIPNLESGAYSVAYTNTCGIGQQSSVVNIAIAKLDQTVSFTAVPTKTFGDAPFTVSATATSTLPISSYVIQSGPATISGTTVTITGAGTIVIRATQDGNATFNAAFTDLSVTVNKAPATITLSNLLQVYDGSPKSAIATTNPLGLNNSITYDGNPASPVNAGLYAVVANITSPNYSGTASGTLKIDKANQSINLPPIADKSFSSAPFQVTATATSGLPVVLTIVTVPATGVASITGNTITLLGAGGTVTVTANQTGNANYNAANAVSVTFNVTPPAANDLQVISLLAPLGGCSLGSQAMISARILNAGATAATGFPVSYQVNNGQIVTETVSATIAAGQSLDYSFDMQASFPAVNANYAIRIFTALTGDQDLHNDTLTKVIRRSGTNATGVSADTVICKGSSATLRAFGGGIYAWAGGPSTSNFIVSPLSTTTYQVAVTDVNGCSTTNHNVTVTVNNNPVAFAGNDQAILRGSSATLTASGGIRYLWNTGDTATTIDVSPQNTTDYILTAFNAAGCSSSDTVKVVVNFSAISVSPSILDFGSVVVDSTKTLSITITNTGTLTENIASITGLAIPFTTTYTAPSTLAPGASVTIPVRFLPTGTLFYQNNVTVTTSAGNFNLVFKGRGVVAAPAWTVTPPNYDFGNVEKNTFASKDFIIKNTGNVSIRVTTVTSSSARFVGTVNGVLNIPVGGSIVLNVKFNPTAITTYSGTITVRTSTANLGVLRAIVSGSGYVDGPPPVLLYPSMPFFNDTSGVSPYLGAPGIFTYSIIYKHPNGVAPKTGFPKVGIDKNGDGDFADAGEGIFSLVKDSSTSNWTQGESYTLPQNLPVGSTYGYQFFATDSLNNSTVLNQYKPGPVVTRETLDLHIFASDIVFSNNNPAVNQNFQVSATVHNGSPYSASDVNVRFYYKDSIFLFEDNIPFIDGNSDITLTHTLSFSPDGFYPIKVWIDSAHALTNEFNVLNNYASRPVIVGLFTLPATIKINNPTATPDGCSKGKVLFRGNASYAGINLAEVHMVEGATVTITVLDYYGQPRVLTANTDNHGNWSVYDNPCASDPDPQSCQGYLCGVIYHYTVEVTDFTITSPPYSGTFMRPCVNCNVEGQITHGGEVTSCLLENQPYTHTVSISNFTYDFIGNKRCAPTVYNDTIMVYNNGALAYTYTLDSIVSCGSVGITSHFATGLPIGNNYNVSYTHSYYTGSGERQEVSVVTPFKVSPPIFDLYLGGYSKTGHKSFSFADYNTSECGAIPGGMHKIYLYDSLPGYTEKVLIDSFTINSIGSVPPSNAIGLSYSNPNWAFGYHYLTIITDATSLLPESDETNNVLRVVFYVQEPDLIAKGISFSSSTNTAGAQINFLGKFKNTGLDVSVPFKFSFRANGALVGSAINIPSIAEGKELEIVSAPFTIPSNPCPILITTFVDTDNQVQEFKENNNADTAYYGINIKAGRSCDDDGETIGAGFFDPDDVLGTFNCQAYIAPKGVLTNFATTVKNTGSRDAFNIKVKFTLNGNVIGTDVIPRLNAGQKTESGFYYAFDTVGRFIINAYADYTKEICEIDETDNIGFIHVDTKPTAPDLEILSQYIAPSNLNPDPGQTVTVVASILNKGTTLAKPSTVRFWVNDIRLGADIPIDTLDIGQDTTVMATVTYSSNIVGPKIFKVKADVLEQLQELRENNNEATRAIIVGGAPDHSHSVHENITITPGTFAAGDSVTVCNFLRNYGGATGTAILRFSVRLDDGTLILIDSVQFTLGSNDSAQFCVRWKVPANPGWLITEIIRSNPPEFNELNNIDSIPFVPGLPIPVTLISFNGVRNGNNNNLSWQVAAEYNLSHYVLERSFDGRVFESIGNIAALNSGSAHGYTFTDVNAWLRNSSVIYYRLRITDRDGRFRFSQVVRLSNILINHIAIAPNPVISQVNLQVQTTESGRHLVWVLDAAGKRCMTATYGFLPGSQTVSLDATKLAKGAYVLVVQYPGGKTDQITFIKD